MDSGINSRPTNFYCPSSVSWGTTAITSEEYQCEQMKE
jgi:hypothetical protein